jgi:cell division transport system permease protein
MVYLVFMALSFGLSLNNSVASWRQDVANTITVEVSPSPEFETSADQRAETLVTLLRTTAGVTDASIIDADAIGTLLEPWFGTGDLVAELNVPRLIDVTLNDQGVELLDDITRIIQEEVEGVSVDTHQEWLADLIKFARSIQLIAAVVIAMLILSTVSLVVLATRGSLATHHDVVELLHLIGARDNFIARTFQNHYMNVGIRGGIIGVLLGGLTIFGLLLYLPQLEGSLLPSIRLSLVQILFLSGLPILASALTTITARITVLRTLGTIM